MSRSLAADACKYYFVLDKASLALVFTCPIDGTEVESYRAEGSSNSVGLL